MITPLEPRQRLIAHLGGIAGYNDKGFSWAGHDPLTVQANQERAQSVIMQLVCEIGEQAFSKHLLEQLKSGAAARDGSGEVYDQVKAELLPGP